MCSLLVDILCFIWRSSSPIQEGIQSEPVLQIKHKSLILAHNY